MIFSTIVSQNQGYQSPEIKNLPIAIFLTLGYLRETLRGIS